MARLGAQLEVDPSAVYRHFADKGELLRAVGDHALAGVTRRLPDAEWRVVVIELCRRLRRANLTHPHLAELVRAGPPLQSNEFAITERLLAELSRAGLSVEQAVGGYHALIELTIGSAALDAAMEAQPGSQRRSTYAAWRATYRGLDPESYPESVRAAGSLYRGSSEQRFVHALGLLLDGLPAGHP